MNHFIFFHTLRSKCRTSNPAYLGLSYRQVDKKNPAFFARGAMREAPRKIKMMEFSKPINLDQLSMEIFPLSYLQCCPRDSGAGHFAFEEESRQNSQIK